MYTKINYSYDDMISFDEKIKDNIKYFSLVRDFAIKEILSKNPNLYKNILILLIQEVISLNENDTKITLENIELGKTNYKEYNKTIDSYARLNDNIHIDLETNSATFNVIKNRNILYLNKISTKILETKDNIKKLNDIYLIQININTSSSDNKYDYDIYSYVGKKYNKKLTTFIHILVYNVEYYRNLFYNKNRKLKKFELWLVVFSSKNFQELFTTLNYVVNNKTRDRIIREVFEMFSDGFRLDDWKREYAEELNTIVRNEAIKLAQEEASRKARRQALREGKAEGRSEGKLETLINTIKSMLKENCSFDLISRVTGKSIEEIKEIQKSMEI